MYVIPAIDLKDGNCVRLFMGDYDTVHKVSEDPLTTAQNFYNAGSQWIHIVDLDGAKDGKRVNADVILKIRKETTLKIEVGGGIRDMESVDFYIANGINRVILGSAAVKNPEFVKEAVEKYGKKIAIGIDAKDEIVQAEGWTDSSEIHFIDLAKEMVKIGVSRIIFTDISKDGMLSGPNLNQLDELINSVDCDIVASGGVSNLKDIINLAQLNIYGAIVGKAVYTGNLELTDAIEIGKRASYKRETKDNIELDDFFVKSELIPAIIQEASTGEVLMLAYMNKESLQKTLETGYTWFYSRSRKELWNKGATSGHLQKIVEIYKDCDEDTLLLKVNQTGSACHTGNKTCFYRKIKEF